MSRKANPTLIGVFVFGAILIAIGAVVFFGSANFFAKRRTYVSFFTQSVSGLSIGSNVKFKGVTIGKVTKVLIGFVGERQPVYAKVFYEVNESTISRDLGPGAPADLNLFDEQWNERQIQNGLRAKLDFESLISGQLFISLDYVKNPAPFVLHKKEFDGNAIEIPVQPSDIEELLTGVTRAISNLGNIDFLTISKDLQRLIETARTGIEAMRLADVGNSLNTLLNGPELRGTLTSVQTAFNQLDETLKKLDGQITPLGNNLNPAIEELRKTMVQLDSASKSLNLMLSQRSDFRYQLDSTLSQLGSAADAVQRLSEFLERNPNSILFGRKPEKQQP